MLMDPRRKSFAGAASPLRLSTGKADDRPRENLAVAPPEPGEHEPLPSTRWRPVILLEGLEQFELKAEKGRDRVRARP